MADLSLVSTDDLIKALAARSMGMVYAACVARDGEPGHSGYKFRYSGNIAAATGLTIMLQEYLAETLTKGWEDDTVDPRAS